MSQKFVVEVWYKPHKNDGIRNYEFSSLNEAIKFAEAYRIGKLYPEQYLITVYEIKGYY